jgi:hypothetical protein
MMGGGRPPEDTWDQMPLAMDLVAANYDCKSWLSVMKSLMRQASAAWLLGLKLCGKPGVFDKLAKDRM